MHIVCSLDDEYLIPTAVLLTSLCVNNKENKLTVHVVSQKLQIKTKEVLRGIVEDKYKQAIIFHTINSACFLNRWELFNPKGHISLTTFFRLFFSSILPNDVSKIIYLDGDIVVRKDLSSLWAIDISSYALAAVEDEASFVHQKNKLFSYLGYREDFLYFNAGVLLINLDFWRVNNLESLFIDYFQSYNYKLPNNDQDILNGVLFKTKKLLPFTYNMSENFYKKKRESRSEVWAEVDKYLKDPHILHYTRSKKPWLASCAHPLQSEFFKYLDLTQWKGLRPQMSCFQRKKIVIKRLLKYRRVI